MAAGAMIVDTSQAFQADVVLKVQPPDVESEANRFKVGGHLLTWIQPNVNEELVTRLQEKKMTVVGAFEVVLDLQ